MDTCIGQRNYKAFVLLLLYASLFCIYALDDRACLHLAAYHQHAHDLDRSTYLGAIRTFIVLTVVIACSHAFSWISRIFDDA